jgi:hypothetical protein
VEARAEGKAPLLGAVRALPVEHEEDKRQQSEWDGSERRNNPALPRDDPVTPTTGAAAKCRSALGRTGIIASVIEAGKPCDEERLGAAEGSLGFPLPPPMRALVLQGDGRFRTDGQWWVVWPLDRLVADTLTAWADGTLDRALVAFGDDGTGNPFCASVGPDEVVRWSWINGEVEQVEGTFADFVMAWCC